MYEIKKSSNKNLTLSNKEVKVYSNDELRDYITKEEVDLLLEKAFDNKKDWLMIYCLWSMGLRITELISIKKKDIDFFNKLVKVTWLKKRRAVERYLPIPQQTAYHLSVFTGNLNMDDRIFPITRQRAFQVIRKYADVLNKPISPHTFRHSFAVHFLKQTKNLPALQKWLGHSHITTTMIYLRIVQTDLREEIDKVVF